MRVDSCSDGHYVAYHNPAIKDFTDLELASDYDVLSAALQSFTYEGALLFISKQIIDHHIHRVDAREMREAMKRADVVTQFRIMERSNSRTLDDPLSRVLALRLWLNCFTKCRDNAVATEVLKEIEGYFDEVAKTPVVVELVVELYSEYVAHAFKLKHRSVFSSERLQDLLLPQCRSPEDFSALIVLLPDTDDRADAIEEVRARFANTYYHWLDSESDGASTSDQINEAIASVVAAAKELGIDESYLDLSSAEELAVDFSKAEDAEADMRQEEWGFQRDTEQAESREIDDILDSLR